MSFSNCSIEIIFPFFLDNLEQLEISFQINRKQKN